jgi:transposase-like protein
MTTPIELSDPIYHDEEAARLHLESLRWPNGRPICPYCGSVKSSRAINGNSMGPGWYYCVDCGEKFTVRVGAVYERSHIPLHKWLLAFRLMASSKKGISAHQLHRTLNITYKSAWFMAHRIREAMNMPRDKKMGGGGKIVEIDETYTGRRPGQKIDPGGHHKMKVVSLIERGGEARSFHVKRITSGTIRKIVRANVEKDTHMMTDEHRIYPPALRSRASHQTVAHSKGEYVRGNVHVNTAEGFFSVFKRGMKGVYQHCGEQHLHRYLAEFDFRYSNRAALDVDDAERTTRAIKGAEGKRLLYRNPSVWSSRKAIPDA